MGTSITFSGLFSGIPTDDLVDALVDLRRLPITQLENQAEFRVFEKDAYSLVNTKILNLKSSLLNLRLESTFLSKLAESSLPGLLGVTAGFNAQPASHSVTINSIARGSRAISGLGDKSLERAAVKMAFGNTAGIATIAMTANTLGGTRALSGTVLTDTLQAGVGAASVTAGDKIKIDVTLKDTTSNTVYFEFEGGAIDTMEGLREAIQQAFQGEAQVAIDSNGAFVITETDPSGVPAISLDALTFQDADFSGSTFDISLGNTTAGNTATYRTIIGTRTFTTGNSAVIANGTELLINLDQYSGGALSGDETFEINGLQYDGDAVTDSFAINATTTLNDLITQLNTLYNDAPNPPWETVVALENGKITFRDQSTGSSETTVSMYFDDPDGSLNLNTGTFVTVDQGSSDISQTIRTSGFETPAVGRHLVTGTEGKGGVVTGTVSLDAGTILSSLGVTEASLFTIDRDDGSGIIDPVSIFGVSERSTVQDLIDAVNAQVPGVTAQLVDDGAGAYNLQILASEGGVDVRLSDDAAGNGILENVLDPDTLSIDTDISTLTDAALGSVDSATTDTADFTFTTIYKPDNGGPVQRRSVVGTTGDNIEDLIESVQLQGFGGAFSDGVALIYTSQSSEMNVSPATQTMIFGTRDVADPTNTSTPGTNIYTTIDNSGLDIALTSGTFTINGVQITIDNIATQTIDEVMGLVNSSGAGVVMEYDSVHDRFIVYRPEAGNTNPISIGGAGDSSNFFTALGLQTITGAVQYAGTTEGTTRTGSALNFAGLSIPMVSGTFTINGVKITVNTAVDSLDDIIERINDAPAGVNAFFDSLQDRLILSQDLTEPPYFNQIQIGSATDTSNFWASMRMTDTYQVPQGIGSDRVKAQLTVDGINYTRDINEIQDIISDVTLNLKGSSDTPIAVDITADTSKANGVIADFVVAYNEVQELVNIAALSEEERDFLSPLTDKQRSQLTFTEIDEYEALREELYIQEFLYRSTTLSRMDTNLRLNTYLPVASVDEGDLASLADLGITTGSVGLGIDLAASSFLVYDTTDRDEILSRLEGNATLQHALEDDAEEVLAIFGNEEKSTVTLTGSVDISLGITLTAPMSFSIGNGAIQATVELDAGFHPAGQVISEITNSLAQVGMGGAIRTYITDGGFLQFVGESESGRARISIQDLGGGSGIANVLGIASQTTSGDEAYLNAGLGRRLDTFLDGYSGSQGLIQQKIRLGGLIDQELLRISDRIDDYEYRISLYENRLRRQFAAMEVALAQFETTSQFLSAQLAASSSNSSSGGGIPISSL